MNTSVATGEMKHNRLLIALCCILLALTLTGLWNRGWIDYIFFGLVMIGVGLPHGAVDHLIHIRQKQKETLNARTLGYFVRMYLGMMVLYALLWYVMPTLSLVLFIVLSCYHFGQSQLYYFFDREGAHSSVVYTLWGLTVLSYLVCWNAAESVALIGSLIPEIETWYAQGHVEAYVQRVPWGLSLLTVVYLLSRLHSPGPKFVVWEIVSLAAIGLVSYYSGLLVAFTVYFGFWHSTKSLRSIVRIFRSGQSAYNYRQFYKDALFFSLLSIVGILLLSAGSYYFTFGIHPVMLFFVLISLLTFPHMLVLRIVYR